MRSALVVVDMLNDFMDGVLGNPSARGIVQPIQQLAARARTTPDWVVLYANDSHEVSDVELRVFPPHAMAGTPGAAVVDELRPHQGDVVVPKRFYSSFTASRLEDELRSHDVGRLVLVGQHTDCCVRHTAYDAFIRGFELAVCPDATTVFEPGSDEPVSERQSRALEYLQTYYGARVVTTQDVA
ncbi:MAG: cysteine hydrolase [Actinomycetota bacterium]|jgi:nicotinamidase-related amidase|nr:cysteine hydrolase [Actinomycetota bacterium]